MSLENIEQQPVEQAPEPSAVMVEGSELYDAQGNLRTRKVFEDGRVAMLSEEEYKAELEASKEQ